VDESAGGEQQEQPVIEVSEHQTRIGDIKIGTSGPHLLGLALACRWPRVERHLSRWSAAPGIGGGMRLQHVADRLDAYMAGELDGIAVRLSGTEFQRRVWTAIRGVPADQVLTYAELAVAARNPRHGL
jgi:methylated-DNA-[protein]-cysteine S-methyltransferase